MNKKGPILGIAIISIIIGIAVSVSSSDESFDVDMTQTHGSISTSLGSPILGNPDAPITIVEFGDYQCHQCYNWFHNTKPMIMRDYIDTGKANLVFIDMRGNLGGVDTICGDMWYDYAKIYQSLIGYDAILLGKFVDRDYKSSLIRYFDSYVSEKFSPERLELIKQITSSLLFSLIPLHDDSPKLMEYFELIG